MLERSARPKTLLFRTPAATANAIAGWPFCTYILHRKRSGISAAWVLSGIDEFRTGEAGD
jgi:hypothetical protein